jgi:hypothetical protein
MQVSRLPVGGVSAERISWWYHRIAPWCLRMRLILRLYHAGTMIRLPSFSLLILLTLRTD